jgi:hypothetical protein
LIVVVVVDTSVVDVATTRRRWSDLGSADAAAQAAIKSRPVMVLARIVDSFGMSSPIVVR